MAQSHVLDRERELFVEFTQATKRLKAEHDELLSLYPDKWVAMSKDGVVASDETIEGIVAAYTEAGYEKNQLVVEFIDTDPPVILL